MISSAVRAQAAPDQELLAFINGIRAIDNHSHPRAVIEERPGAGTQKHPLGESWPSLEERLRPSNPQWIVAWKALYSYPYRDTAQGHVERALAEKGRLMSKHGDAYPSAVLDRLGIDIVLANVPSLGRGLAGPRFRWVPFGDGFMLPVARIDPTGTFRRRRVEVGLDSLPPRTLAEFVENVVGARMHEWKSAGAVAVKLQIAYYRSLDVARVSDTTASRVYESLVRGERASPADRKALEDYLLMIVARDAGTNKLALHIHTGEGGGPFFDTPGSSPLLLTSLVNDYSLRNTTFVLVHGGFPFDRATATLIKKPNVYTDFSGLVFFVSPSLASQTLRLWLETFPEKVMFGTDAFDLADSSLRGWEELGWVANQGGREALAIALTSMMNDGLLTRARAKEIAAMVMRGNAARLYGF